MDNGWIDKLRPDELSDELLSVGELVADDEWQIVNDSEHYTKEEYSTPEQETDLEHSQIERRENTNLKILEWMRDVKSKEDEGQSIQQVDVSAEQHVKTEDDNDLRCVPPALRLDGNRQAAQNTTR